MFTTKIIKAGALLPDTKALLSCWDPGQPVAENLRQIRCRNLLGKTSRSRAEAILAIFRQRYLYEESVAKALAHLVRNRCNGSSVDRILYFHAARADALLFNVVLEMLVPQWTRGVTLVSVTEVHRTLRQWSIAGKTTTVWSDATLRRVVQGLLSTLRDFGVLQGAVNKRIAPAYLPLQAFCYIAFYLKQQQASGAKLLDMADWKLFFLPREGVERFMVDAHQHDLLEYHAAGSVTRLSFPAATLEEYADVLARAAN
ncbi:MAG: DUF1819 family protein [Rhodopirellula sp.]|nr:DUF1819 family protein [Rhodopirellula sp.]